MSFHKTKFWTYFKPYFVKVLKLPLSYAQYGISITLVNRKKFFLGGQEFEN